jgi:hypothetical protein
MKIMPKVSVLVFFSVDFDLDYFIYSLFVLMFLDCSRPVRPVPKMNYLYWNSYKIR